MLCFTRLFTATIKIINANVCMMYLTVYPLIFKERERRLRALEADRHLSRLKELRCLLEARVEKEATDKAKRQSLRRCDYCPSRVLKLLFKEKSERI